MQSTRGRECRLWGARILSYRDVIEVEPSSRARRDVGRRTAGSKAVTVLLYACQECYAYNSDRLHWVNGHATHTFRLVVQILDWFAKGTLFDHSNSLAESTHSHPVVVCDRVVVAHLVA